MLKLDEALGPNATSKSFFTTTATDLWIRFSGDFDGETVTVQYAVEDSPADFVTLNVEETDQTFTAAGQFTTLVKYPLPGGLRFQCVVSGVSGTPDIDIHVGGHGVKIIV